MTGEPSILSAVEDARRILAAQREDLAALDDRLSAALNGASNPVKGGLTEAEKLAFPVTSQRAGHLPGKQAKLDTDHELRAFVEARLDRMTFTQIAAAVAEAFPPDRRIGRSAIHSWWTKRKAGR